MTIYFIDLLCIALLNAIIKPKLGCTRKKWFVISSMLLLGLTAGCRSYLVGIDTYSYYWAYNYVDFDNSYYEPGFLLLIKFLNLFSDNPQTIIAASSLFICFSVGLFVYRSSDNVFISIVLFVTLLSYASFMNLMRQALAVSILLFAYPSLCKKQFGYAAIIILLASSFHSSALIWLALIPLSMIRFSKKALVAYVVVLAVLFVFPSQAFLMASSALGKYDGYLTSKWGGGNSFAAPIMSMMDFILLCIAWIAWKPGRNKLGFDTNLQFHALMLLLLLQILACQINIYQRLISYYSLFVLSLVPSSLRRFSPKSETLLDICIVVITVVFFAVIMVFRPDWQGVVPYTAFWDI